MGLHNNLYLYMWANGPPIATYMSKFYSRCKKCDIEKTVGGGYHHPLGSL